MSERLWTPSFVGLSFAGFFNSMIFYLLVPAMAGHAVDSFGATPVEAGALASIFFVGALLARLFGGWLTDRFGPRHVALAASAFYVVTTAAYLVAPGLWVMMGVRLLNGIGFGLLGSALVGGVMMTLPAGRRAEGAGWFSVGISIAIGIGPWLALTLLGIAGMRWVFIAALVAAVLTLVLLLVFRRGLPGRPDATQVLPPFSLRTLLDSRAMGMGVVIGLSGFAYSSILAFLDPATRDTPLAPAAAWFFLTYALVVLVARPAAGRAQDLLGEGRVIAPALLGFAVAMGVVASAQAGWWLLAGAAALGLTWGTMTTGGQAAIVSRVPRDRTGAAVATHFFMLDAGTGVGPILFGFLVPTIGYRGVFWVGAGLALLALPVYLRDLSTHRRRGGSARHG